MVASARALFATGACLTAVAAAAPGAAAMEEPCPTDAIGGHVYRFTVLEVSCSKATKGAKKLVKSNGDKRPNGFKCKAADKFRKGGRCDEKDGGGHFTYRRA